MRKQIQFECYKMIRKRMLWLLLPACMLIHLVVLHQQMNVVTQQGYSLKEMSVLYESMSEQERSADALEQQIANMEQKRDAAHWNYEQSRRLAMLQKMYERSVETERYDTYLEQMQNEADRRMTSPLYALSETKPDNYTYENLRLTKQAYAHLRGIVLENDFDSGIELVAADRTADMILLLFIMLFAVQLFVAERENGTWFLIKAMPGGHASLILAKLITMLLMAITGVVLFYGSGIALVWHEIGFGDMQRVLQSVEGFYTCNLSLTVGQFLCLFILMKILCLSAIGMVAGILCVFFKNTVISITGFVLLFLAEYAAWIKIYTYSWLAPFKEWNLAALFFTEHYFQEFYHINLFSVPVSHRICGICMFVMCVAGGSVLLLFLHELELEFEFRIQKKHAEKTRNIVRRWKEKIKKHLKQQHNIFLYSGRNVLEIELYKQFWINKGGMILAAFFFIWLFPVFSSHYFVSSEEYYYQEYSKQLQGELSVQKEEYLAEEKLFFETLPEQRACIRQAYERGELDAVELENALKNLEIDEAREHAFDRALEQYETVKRQVQGGAKLQYVYKTPWEILLGEAFIKADLLRLGICFLVMILLTASSGALEKQNHMELLYAVTVTGTKGVRKYKIGIFEGTAVLAAVMAFLPNFMKVVSKYGIGGFLAPAASYFGEIALWVTIPLGVLLVLKYFVLVSIIMAQTAITWWISEKVGNRVLTILIGAVAFLLPVFLGIVFF